MKKTNPSSSLNSKITKYFLYFFLYSLALAVAFIVLLPTMDLGFWRSFYEGWIKSQPQLILKSLAPMAPPIIFSLLISAILGKLTASKLIGKRHSFRVIMLSFMFGMYGTLIGYILGASSQSIAKEVLTSLVTVLSALFGYFISRELPVRFRAMMPTAILCFILSVLFASHFYSALRENLTIS